jgi:hypothetical protein
MHVKSIRILAGEPSQEELTQLDTLTKKLAEPAQDAAHNQIESNTALELVELVECDVPPHEAP